MDDEGVEGSGVLKKNKLGAGEVDFKEKSGTAWSHSFLNQKPWHPLSYPNQRRKWIAEQTDAQHQRRAEEVAREFAQEQEFFRQSALISKKEKEKVEIMKAVSFMYVRPPGYNAESAKAAELEDERRKSEGSCPPQLSTDSATIPSSIPPEEKKKSRPKDVYGRTLPTEEEFEVLKNAPRLETGLPARAKPFGIEVRNVKCLRCGNYGHQSGDRECSLRDAIMPNEENRLKRDDPLTSIMAHTDTSEPLKWELKQKPGISPPRGGFKPDDPNQQIVAEDIFDEYGGFLSGGIIPDLLTNFSVKKSKKHSKSKSKYKGESSTTHDDPKVHKSGLSPSYSDSDREKSSKKRKMKKKQKKEQHTDSLDKSIYRKHHHRSEHRQPVLSSSDDSEADIRNKRSKPLRSVSPDDSDHGRHQKRKKNRHTVSLDDSDHRRHKKRSKPQRSISPDDSKHDKHSQRNKIRRSVSPHDRDRHKKRSKPQHSVSPDDCRHRSVSPHDRARHKKRSKPQHSVSPDDCRHHDRNKHRRAVSPGDSGHYRHNIRSKPQPSVSPDDRRHHSKHKHRRSVSLDGSDNDRHNKKNRHRRSISSDSAENDKDHKWNRYRGSISPDDSYYDRHHKRNNHR